MYPVLSEILFTFADSTCTVEVERLLWRCMAMPAISFRAATSAVPLATRKNTSSRVVTLKP